MICRRTESNDILLELVAKTLVWLLALTRWRSSMKTARSMSSRFKKGLALVSPAWMRAVRRRELCERRCIRSGESKRLSLSRGVEYRLWARIHESFGEDVFRVTI